ncbi:MAG TPA: hypothetical protein VHW02_12715 [Rhizomicrobium sp.]|jgi:hypothetical protein|nr:hypothetical protein [Rhizomicrobium sp.]
MELAETPRGEGIFTPENRQRLAVGAVVALLHLIAIFLLIRAGMIPIPPALQFHELPITIWLNPPKKSPVKAPQKPKPVVQPIPTPEPVINQTLRSIQINPQTLPPATDYNGMHALGRYMKNCSNGDYGYLSKGEWHLCLGSPTQAQMAVGLGQEAPSIWQQQRDAARKPEAPFEAPCPLGSRNSNTGVPPCHSFSGSALGLSGPTQQ